MSDVRSDQDVLDRIATVDAWYHQIEIRPGIVTPGINASATTLARLQGLPEDCRGLRVLDIGARDGFFAFEFERRGAEVVAIDHVGPDQTGFGVARELVGSAVELEVCNVYDLDPAVHGTFDVVLLLGVLYHLRNPLLALDRVWDVCRDGAVLALETQILDHTVLLPDGSTVALAELDPRLAEIGLMQFFPGDALNGDPTNYWAPNATAARQLLADAGFACRHEHVEGPRGIFVADRVWDEREVYLRRRERSIP